MYSLSIVFACFSAYMFQMMFNVPELNFVELIN